MPIVGLSNFTPASDGDGANGRELPPYGPGGIYHEKQIGSLCAVHCVNNLLQGPLFDEWAFRSVAQELDQAERSITGGEGLDYGNARMDGFFNVQVVQAVLGRAGYMMQAIKGEEGRTAQADTAKETAFILNKREHWFALRRIGREWFDLNSCLHTPRHYTDGDLRFYIGDAVREGYTVFVVRGQFPRCALEEDPKKLVEAIQGCGRPEQGYSLFAGSGQRLDNSSSDRGAISNATVGPAPGSAEALRAARLARFGGGGAAAPSDSPAAAPAEAAAPTTPALAAPVAVAPAPTAAPAAPSAAEAAERSNPALAMLLAMGFPRAANGSPEMAAEILLGA